MLRTWVVILAVVLSGAGMVFSGDAVRGQESLTAYKYPEPVAPLPEVVEGGASWTIGEMIYTGEFPDGMRFSLEVASDAGEIVNARVVWKHAPGNNTRRSQPASFDDRTGLWVADWPHDAGDVPPWVLVRYRWELTDAAGNRYLTAEQDEVYADADNADRWRMADSVDAVVYWIDLDDGYGQQTLAAMAEQHTFYEQAWGGLLPYRPRIILYGPGARLEYEAALGRRAQVGSGITTGTTSEDWGGSIQLAYGDTDYSLAYGTVLHEVAHLYQSEFAHLPVGWFVEGNAEFFNLARGDSYRLWAYSRLMSSDPLSFEAGFSIRGRTFRDGYQLGATVFDYLVEVHGLDAHRQVWDLISTNMPPFEAIETVTGMSIQAFEQGWRAWLGVNTPPPTSVPLPTPMLDILAIPTPTFPPPPG